MKGFPPPRRGIAAAAAVIAAAIVLVGCAHGGAGTAPSGSPAPASFGTPTTPSAGAGTPREEPPPPAPGRSTPEQEKVRAEAIAKREKAIRAEHPEWPEPVVTAAAAYRPEVGMTREQVRAALPGKPNKTTRNVLPDGTVLETWFPGGVHLSPRLQFRNGVLVNIEVPGRKVPSPKDGPAPPASPP